MFTKKIILGSSSPRRKQLIESLGFNCEIRKQEVEEVYPADIDHRNVPEYLSILKAEPLKTTLKENEVLITSDTIVLLNNKIIGKPIDVADAKRILKDLSGMMHEVISGVYVYSLQKEESFSVATKVYFKKLSDDEIDYYVEKYQPLDKAGAYGIQEWIGMIGIEKIEGSYYNVMGLPVFKLWEILNKRF